jgi:hypothetical protein
MDFILQTVFWWKHFNKQKISSMSLEFLCHSQLIQPLVIENPI